MTFARRPWLRGLALVQALLLLGTGTLSAAGPAPASGTVNLGQLQLEIDALKAQVGAVGANVQAAEAAAKPLIATGHDIVARANSFPSRVDAFRQRYGIPLENPTVDQEWTGIQRYLLEKGGMSPKQAEVMAVKMGSTPIIEHLKQPFRPQSILMAVGATAGMNILAQVRAGETLDLGKAVSFIGDKKFWSGMVASGVAYGVASWAVMSMLPPGMGVLAALLPTFAGMAASAFGWEVGQGGTMQEVLGRVSFAELLGQAAGSTLGMIMGGQLAAVMFAGLGLAGPLGAIVGAMVLGSLGAKIAGFVRDFLKGDKEALQKAKDEVGGFLDKSQAVVKRLEEAGLLETVLPAGVLASDPSLQDVKARYSDSYQRFVLATKEERNADAVVALRDLRRARAEYDRRVRDALSRLDASEGR